MSKILDIRIFPPIAISRFGSASDDLDGYTVEINEKNPLDFRDIVPESTAIIEEDGKIVWKKSTSISFKDNQGKIKPVSPFLELFVCTDDDTENFIPLTANILKIAGASLADVSVTIRMENHKMYRRTNDLNDVIKAEVTISGEDYAKKELLGKCENFINAKTISLGHIQFINPTTADEVLRLRFTAPAGKVYGPDTDFINEVIKSGSLSEEYRAYLNQLPDDQRIYESRKGGWTNYKEGGISSPVTTNPSQIYAGYDIDDEHYSLGMFDDASDGFVEVKISEKLSSRATLVTAPPAFAPDLIPIRLVTDELEQILFSPELDQEETVHIEDVQEILRRAMDSIRLMNTAIINGNSFNGLSGTASTMPRQDSNDTNRLFEPVMSPEIVDNFTLLKLHEKIYSSLESGIAPWFINSIRMPNEIGKLDNETRRKMPAMMRGADARALTLTYRQINTIIKAIYQGSLQPKEASRSNTSKIKINDYRAQLNYRGEGNPYCVLPAVAISNCFPGLEFDFKNLWCRAFEGIELSENNNYVMNTDLGYNHLLHTRLVGIDERPTVVQTTGPVLPNGKGGNRTLATPDNPQAAVFMEWSNNLVYTLEKKGQDVMCYFTKGGSEEEVLVTDDDLKDFRSRINAQGALTYTTKAGVELQWMKLKVRPFFESESIEFSKDLIKPGEFTRGLCSPWQNDFKECACYYWAASRPDYVNITQDDKGFTKGDNWMAKNRTGNYIPDTREDSHFVSYTELFEDWEKELHFIIKGKDEVIKNDNAD